MIRLLVTTTLLLLVATLSQADICPYSSAYLNITAIARNFEGFDFPHPLSNNDDNVTDTQNRWVMRYFSISIAIDEPFGYLGSVITADLINKRNGTRYSIRTVGPSSFLSIRTSADLRWITLQDISISGNLTGRGVLQPINSSIAFAEFLSDSPRPDSSYHKKHEELDPDTGCSFKYVKSGGKNVVQNKSFWITLNFSDGTHAAFQYPEGSFGTYTGFQLSGWYADCNCS